MQTPLVIARIELVHYTSMFKQFLLKKLVQSQLSKIPADQRALVEKILEEKPELLMQIAQEVKALMDAGKDQQAAMLEIAKKYESQLKGVFGK